eukprot:GILI01005384.1.p1 GENE.GILI01005384.1~~GILI01005384.1.p1  ORF type:complete len:594 (+),score=97.15 GILI01005384.1:101-1882(+)
MLSPLFPLILFVAFHSLTSHVSAQDDDGEVYVNPYPPEIPPPKVIPPSINVTIGNYTSLLVDLYRIEDEDNLPIVRSSPDALPLTAANLTDITVVATDYLQAFALFKIKFQRDYKTSSEEQIRFRNFLRNMGAAFRNQTSNPYASYGINNFSDYDLAEFARNRNLTDFYKNFDDAKTSVPNQRREDASSFYLQDVGLDFLQSLDTKGHLFWDKGATKRRMAAMRNKPYTSNNTRAVKDHPAAKRSHGRRFTAQSSPLDLDWRAFGAVTPVRQQGSCGGCWAFAASGNIEGAWRIAGKGLVPLSEQSLISCDTFSGNLGCSGGVPQYAFQYLIKYQDGYVARRDTYPFTSGTGYSPVCRPTQYVKGARINRYVSITRDENVMMQFVANIGPIAVAIDSTSWLSYTGGIITDCLSLSVDHAVLIVGFDIAHDPPYWIVKNSWGPDWGEEGYVRIAKGTNQCLITKNPSTALANVAAAIATQPVTTTPTTTNRPTAVPTDAQTMTPTTTKVVPAVTQSNVAHVTDVNQAVTDAPDATSPPPPTTAPANAPSTTTVVNKDNTVGDGQLGASSPSYCPQPAVVAPVLMAVLATLTLMA